jgi:hypothetical protein
MEPKGNKNFMDSLDINIGLNFTFNAHKFKNIPSESFISFVKLFKVHKRCVKDDTPCLIHPIFPI